MLWFFKLELILHLENMAYNLAVFISVWNLRNFEAAWIVDWLCDALCLTILAVIGDIEILHECHFNPKWELILTCKHTPVVELFDKIDDASDEDTKFKHGCLYYDLALHNILWA